MFLTSAPLIAASRHANAARHARLARLARPPGPHGHLRWLAVVALGSALASPVALAQIEEVVVTAERREASLQTVPVAITAINAKQMEEKLVTNIHDLQYQSPNFSMARNTGTASGARIFMRGIGEDESRVTADPAIGIYVDGVYLGRQTGAMLDLLDLERIEILRGPQGTLYGRNSSAGAIKLITVKPGEENEATLGGTIGSEGRVDFRASGNLAFSDSVAARATLLSRARDGLHTVKANGDYTADRETGEIDVFATRLAFRFHIDDRWTADLAIDQTDDRSDPAPGSLAGSADRDDDLFTIEPAPDTTTAMLVETDMAGVALAPARMIDPNACRSRPHYHVEAGNTTATTLSATSRHALGCENYFSSEVKSGGLTLTVTGELDDYILSALIGTRQLEDDLNTHISFNFTQQTDQDQVSLEFSVASNYDGPMNFVAGLYHFTEDVTLDSVFFLAHTIDLEAESTALFAHGNYEINEALTLTAGLRYTDESKDLDAAQGSLANISSNGFTNTSFKIAADYQFSDDMMVYGSLVTGFKSGGWSPDCFAPTACFLPVEEEEVQTLEVGLRSDWLGERLRFNATAFMNAYDNQQIAASVPGLGFTRFNVSESETSGIEIELVYQPTDNLRLNATLSSLDSEYTSLNEGQSYGLTNADYDAPAEHATTSDCGLNRELSAGQTLLTEEAFGAAVLACAYGLEMKNAPASQIAVGALYTMPLMGGELAIGIDVAIEDDSWNLVANGPATAQTDPGTIINSRIAYSVEHWQVALWGKNLGDEEYARASVASGAQYAADPVLVGLDFRYDF